MEKKDYINWWEETKEDGLEELKTTFIDLFSGTDFLPSIYHPLLYKYLRNSQIKHWNKDIFNFSKNKINGIKKSMGKEAMDKILLSNLHLLTATYQNLLDLEERIILMDRFRGSEELKAKTFSINIYNDLLNNGFIDILELFTEFQSVIEGNDSFQKSLTAQINCLASPKRGYHQITDLADSDIRNAISHGGVKTEGSKMIFSYKVGSKHFRKELNVYDFKDLVLQLYDGVSAVLLAWIGYLCTENISYNEIYKNEIIHEETTFFYERLSLSTLLTTCERVWQLEVNNQKSKHQQVNIEFTGVDLDIDSRVFIGLYSAERIYHLRKLNKEDSIMISFNSSKTIKSFFRIGCDVVSDLSKGVINIEKAYQSVLQSQDILMFPVNEEERNVFEDRFRYYPDIETEDFTIKEIEDNSTEKQKKFKAVVYLKKAKRKKHVEKAIVSVIKTIIDLENFGFSSQRVKHGKMEADIIYLVLYKKEVRRSEDRSLFPKNHNFVAQVQYDAEAKFPIRNKFIDNHLKKRVTKKVEYLWNPNFY